MNAADGPVKARLPQDLSKSAWMAAKADKRSGPYRGDNVILESTVSEGASQRQVDSDLLLTSKAMMMRIAHPSGDMVSNMLGSGCDSCLLATRGVPRRAAPHDRNDTTGTYVTLVIALYLTADKPQG